MEHQHVFAGNPLDRGEAQRRDDAWLAAASTDPTSRFLPFYKQDVLLAGAHLKWLSGAEVNAVRDGLEPILLGLADGIAHFAIEVDEPTAQALLALGDGEFQDCRAAAMAMPDGAETGIIAQARAQVGWHASHRFCSQCGTESVAHKGGHERVCPNCGAHHFPRTDPVAIMLVESGDRCLLGQSHGPLVAMGMYSALAGFVDQGETIEEAVRREVREEAGLTVGEVRYHSSQPWPFPNSLMIGCIARATTTEVVMDEVEMHDVRWFERADVLAVMNGATRDFKLPGPIAIAHHLIKAWAAGD